MLYSKEITEIIRKRKSTRTFDGRKLTEDNLRKLNAFIDEINNTIDVKARFMVIADLEANDEPKKLGTYGFIQGAKSFIVGILDKDANDAFGFGYNFEKIILYAVDLGIDVCWVGGTFNKGSFQQMSGAKENEYIPIIAPAGYKSENKRFFETAIRKRQGSDNRKPFGELFFNKDMHPLSSNDAGEYLNALEMVRLGPSAINKQPWRIMKDGDMFHFYICRNKGFDLASFDFQKNDLGIAKCHFELTLDESKIRGQWQELKEVDVPNGWEYIYTWENSAMF